MSTPATGHGALFDCTPPVRKKAPDPAYLPTRPTAEGYRDSLLADFRLHQSECAQCLAAADPPPGRRPTDEVCVTGLLLVYQAGRIEHGLRLGYYPEPRKDHRTSTHQPDAVTSALSPLFDLPGKVG